MSENFEPGEGSFYSLISPFWIDTDGYTERDQLMFCCGYEFNTVLEHIRDNEGEYRNYIHKENESRIRMACGRFKRACTIEPCAAEHDPDGTWSLLVIEATS